jgi:Cu+-exporting ATPase
MKLKEVENLEIQNYEEIPGLGIEAEYMGNTIKIGKLSWLFKTATNRNQYSYEHSDISNETQVYISLNSKIAGYFAVVPEYREGIAKSLSNFSEKLDISVVSGDNDKDRERLERILPPKSEMLFNYLPDDKYNYIDALKQSNKKVIMIGDGLNDAGALKIADLGIAVTENTSSFTPESDAILNADNLEKLDKFYELSRKSLKTVYLSYGISILYNIVGLSFALSANLSPVVAAILMPVSSVSVVAFTVGKSIFDAKRLKL